MKSQRLSLILILLMAMMPVVVAFAHYSALGGQLFAAQNVVAAEMAGHDNSAHADHCQPEKSQLANCSFHVCVGCAMTSSFDFMPSHGPSHYRDTEKPASVSLLPAPEIKPPILSL